MACTYGPSVIPRVLRRRGRSIRAREGDVEAQAEMGRTQGCKPRNGKEGGSSRGGSSRGGKEADSPLELPEGANVILPTHLGF